MDDHPVHTTPNHNPPKIDVLPKTFFQIILAAKSIVQHSIQLRPSIISDDLFGFSFCEILILWFQYSYMDTAVR